MKLVRYDHDGRRFTGRIDGDTVTPLGAGNELVAVASGIVAGTWPEPAGDVTLLSGVRLLAPFEDPPTVRDFSAFEQHVKTARASRGQEMMAEWYEAPVFFFSHPGVICGPHDEIPYPSATAELDYEVEVAAVIGTDGGICGFTVMNDWSARDIQRREMKLGLGPAKAKDFATSLGPCLVTVDEFDGAGPAAMVGRVNGDEWSRGDLADLHWTWAQMIELAGRDSVLRPGAVIGSGTVGTGCALELVATGHPQARYLRPGDVVDIEVEGIGVLTNTVGARTAG